LSTLDRVTELVRELLDTDHALTADTRPSDVEEWDSLANINIVFALEQEFGVFFDDEQVAGFATIGDIAAGVDTARERAA
jgi:acyl carrier protein